VGDVQLSARVNACVAVNKSHAEALPFVDHQPGHVLEVILTWLIPIVRLGRKIYNGDENSTTSNAN